MMTDDDGDDVRSTQKFRLSVHEIMKCIDMSVCMITIFAKNVSIDGLPLHKNVYIQRRVTRYFLHSTEIEL